MAPRAADVLDIRLRARDPQAALDGHGARRGGRDLAEKRGDERLHPGDRKERRRHLVRNERRRRDVRVPLRNEKLDERTPKFLTRECHDRSDFPAANGQCLSERRGLLEVDVRALFLGEAAHVDHDRHDDREGAQDDSNDLCRHAP